ncbi:DUF421 domain-containing protein [Paenibacillus sp. J5C_2022]|uniref:DUF421 domain-containing protein n=1 Tax=Paenibacillus sp. J5C2022 TaxID=2977129 RepID=UPI0021CF753E|nr:DUF421 domain-containing protein [Paenibacillus sp. J5C2022]MCU6711765.1 DUF421 domain-containing protein [Paenibacillus sp. J5C2022]
MHFVKDSLLVLGRIYTIFPLLLIIALFMGRRSIAQLPIFDFLIIISLGSVVGADIADPRIEHIHTAIAIAAIGLLQKATSYLMLKYRKFSKMITFEPIIVMKDGRFIHKNVKKAQYTVDDLLLLLREYQIFDPSTVDMAILEGNGGLSVLKKVSSQNVTMEHAGLASDKLGVAYPVIKEGVIQSQTLQKLGYSEVWLLQQLNDSSIRLADVFFASLNDKKELSISGYHSAGPLPPVYH